MYTVEVRECVRELRGIFGGQFPPVQIEGSMGPANVTLHFEAEFTNTVRKLHQFPSAAEQTRCGLRTRLFPQYSAEWRPTRPLHVVSTTSNITTVNLCLLAAESECMPSYPATDSTSAHPMLPKNVYLSSVCYNSEPLLQHRRPVCW